MTAAVKNPAVTKQPAVIERFQQMIENRHLAHAYLLTGASGTGKKEVARWVAERLFCQNLQDGMPCGKCEECHRISTGQHPDVVEIEPDGQSIKVDQVRFLKAEFSKSGVEGNRKVFIIDQAHLMTTSAANSLLKFIEEPAGNVTAFLLTESKNLILPTIMSRTEIIELKPLQKSQLVAELTADGEVTESTAHLLVRLTSDREEMQSLLENNWIEDAHKALEKWFGAVTKGDMSAFVDVQTRIIGLAKDREHQAIVLDMMMLYAMDLLALKFGQADLTYLTDQAALRQVAEQTTVSQLLKVSDLLLPLCGKLKQNLNFQGIVEKVTIELCDIFKMRG